MLYICAPARAADAKGTGRDYRDTEQRQRFKVPPPSALTVGRGGPRETATVGDRDAFGDALRRTDGSAAVSRGVEPATCKYERSRGVNQLLICVVTKHGYALHDLTHENRNL